MRSSSERFLLRQPGRSVLVSFTEQELRLGVELGLVGEDWPVRPEGQAVETTVGAMLAALCSAARVWPGGAADLPPEPPPTRPGELALACQGCGHGLRLCLATFDAVTCPCCGGEHSVIRATAGTGWSLGFVPRRGNAGTAAAGANRADPHTVLGVQRGATRAEVKAAYKERMREYHPDKVAHLGAELRALAEAKAKQINAAFEALG